MCVQNLIHVGQTMDCLRLASLSCNSEPPAKIQNLVAEHKLKVYFARESHLYNILIVQIMRYPVLKLSMAKLLQGKTPSLQALYSMLREFLKKF